MPREETSCCDAFPSTESISEIRADGVLANAEFGNPAQIVVTTKGGTNTLHGSGFFYYQDSAFDAIPYTYPTTKTKASRDGQDIRRHRSGGPVVIPHLYNGHNKSFFFGAYEGWRHPAQQTIFEVVPSTAMKQGDFSNYNSPGFTALMDPFTGSPVPGNKIPSGYQPDRAEHAEAVLPRPEHRRSVRIYAMTARPTTRPMSMPAATRISSTSRGDQYLAATRNSCSGASSPGRTSPSTARQFLLVPSRRTPTRTGA